MEKQQPVKFVRTTIYLPRHLHEQAKIMAILTRTNLSHLMRVSLSEKIKQLKDSVSKESKDNNVYTK